MKIKDQIYIFKVSIVGRDNRYGIDGDGHFSCCSEKLRSIKQQ